MMVISGRWGRRWATTDQKLEKRKASSPVIGMTSRVRAPSRA